MLFKTADELVKVNGLGSGLFSLTGGTGDAGTIIITTPELKVLDSAQIGVNNFIEESFDVLPNGRLDRNILEQPQEGTANAGTIDSS